MNDGSGGGGWLQLFDRSIRRLTRVADELAAAVCAILIVVTTFSVIVYQRGITIVWLDDVLRMLGDGGTAVKQAAEVEFSLEDVFISLIEDRRHEIPQCP